jgi:uncharacterized protein
MGRHGTSGLAMTLIASRYGPHPTPLPEGEGANAWPKPTERSNPASIGWLKLLLACLIALGAFLPVHAEVAVPDLNRRVTDLTGTLTPDTVNRLETTLAQFESAKGSQIAVLMLPTTRPEDIAEYGIRVAEQWKVGRKGVDDGAILIVAKDDRRVRIEVGYGLEGVLSDAVTKRIIEEDITPRFRQGDFSGGVEAGVSRMMRLIEGEPLPPPKANTQGGVDAFMDRGLLFIIVGIFAGSLLRMLFGKGTGSVVGALGAGGLAWFFSGLLFVGIVVAVIVLLGILGGGRGGGGGWSSGGFGGSSWGGGGFSGGGGGFGGGGSSGSW